MNLALRIIRRALLLPTSGVVATECRLREMDRDAVGLRKKINFAANGCAAAVEVPAPIVMRKHKSWYTGETDSND